MLRKLGCKLGHRFVGFSIAYHCDCCGRSWLDPQIAWMMEVERRLRELPEHSA